jgi:hypothetical protein
VDHRGTIHQIAHHGNNGLALHSRDGIEWWWNASVLAYNASVWWSDGTVIAMHQREEPKMLLGADGLPTHLINLCTLPSIAHSFVCVQPIASGGV